MATKTWIDGTGDWNTASDWSTGMVPGPGDDAVIPFGTVSLTTPVTVGSITLNPSGTLGIVDQGGTETVTGNFSNSGTAGVDFGAGSGSTLTIGGTLTNAASGSFNIGYFNLFAASTVTAAALSNAGRINLAGGTSAQATLNIAGPAPATLTGNVNLQGSALLEFGSGGITTIADGARLELFGFNGPPRVAISGDTGANSALAHLSSNAGILTLYQTVPLTTDPGTDFSNSGSIWVSGGTLALGGVLTNTGALLAGNNFGSATTFSAAGFNNTGTFDIASFPVVPGSPLMVTATFGGAVPSTITGRVRLFGNATMQFTGGGTINSIANGATLEVDTWSGSQPSLTGLSGLTSNAGTLNLDARTFGGAGLYGGMNLTFSGTITNTGTINYGNVVVNNGSDLVTMGGLVNTGNLIVQGGQTGAVTLNVLGPAPSTLTGDNYIASNGVLQYGSGAITAIGSGAVLDLNGGRIGVNGQSGNGALSHLAGNAGGLHIAISGGIVTDTNFSNTNFVQIDQGVFAVGGALNNSATFQIGGGTVSAAAFTQTAGSTRVSGGSLSADHVNIAGGSLVFGMPLTSAAHTGPITLSGGSVVTFGAADSSVQVGFGGAGTITLDTGNQFAGTIFHFTNPGEAVDIASLSDVLNDAHTSFNFGSNQLTVFGDNGSVTLQLAAENYSGVTWTAQPDAAGATYVTANFVPGSQYVFFAPGQPINVAATGDPPHPPPPIRAAFNLELVINATGTGNYPTPSAYQGVAIGSADGHTLTLLHGDYGMVDNGAGNTVFLGDGSESIGGAIGDIIQGGSGPNQFLDGHLGHQSITGGTSGNETIWGALTDTITGGSGGNETIAGVAHETILGGAANTFLDATAGNESIVAGTGNTTIWGGARDTVQGTSGAGKALIGFAGGNETFWDDGATIGRHDSISTFNQSGGDRVSLNSATDTPSGVAGTAVTDGAGNTTVTFHDSSTLTFIGIGAVNTGFFTTH